MYGLDNTVVGTKNLVGTRCDIGDIPIESYNFKDFDVKLSAPCDLQCELSNYARGDYKKGGIRGDFKGDHRGDYKGIGKCSSGKCY